MGEIESLNQWDADVSELARLRERLRQRPEYPAAVQRLARNLLRDADEDPSLGGLLKDAGRTVAALSAVSLNASGEVTLQRLKTFIAGFGLVSPGRARLLLGYMLHLGYLERATSGPALRPTVYRLTAAFLGSYTRHEASLLDAASLVEPAAGLVLENLHVPGVLEALVVEQGKTFLAGSSQTPAFAGWYRTFMHRLAGIQILHSLVAEAPSFPPLGAIAFSVPAAARRFQVSRVHVARMMKEAQSQGFVELEQGAVRFTDVGRAALDWLYASRFCVHLACAARALKANPQLLASARPRALEPARPFA